MNGEDLYLCLSQLGLGLAGFAGVVSVFRHSSDEWVPQDFEGLKLIFRLTLSAVFFGLLPSLSFLASHSEEQAVRNSSALLSLFLFVEVFIDGRSVKRGRREGVPPRHFTAFVLSMFVPASILCALLLMNSLAWRKPALYAIAVVFLLFVASVQFFYLVESPKRSARHSDVGYRGEDAESARRLTDRIAGRPEDDNQSVATPNTAATADRKASLSSR